MKIDKLDELIKALWVIADNTKPKPQSHGMDALIHRLDLMEKRLMSATEDINQKLADISAQQESTIAVLVKVKSETQALQNVIQGLTQGIVDLQAQLAEAQANSAIPQAILDAVGAIQEKSAQLSASASAIDDLVPDVTIV